MLESITQIVRYSEAHQTMLCMTHFSQYDPSVKGWTQSEDRLSLLALQAPDGYEVQFRATIASGGSDPSTSELPIHMCRGRPCNTRGYLCHHTRDNHPECTGSGGKGILLFEGKHLCHFHYNLAHIELADSDYNRERVVRSFPVFKIIVSLAQMNTKFPLRLA
jgi:hypothetical protein